MNERIYYSLISTPPRRSVSDTMCMIALRCSKNIVLLVWLSALASAALVRQIHLEPKANEGRDAQYVDCNERALSRTSSVRRSYAEQMTAFKSQGYLFVSPEVFVHYNIKIK